MRRHSPDLRLAFVGLILLAITILIFHTQRSTASTDARLPERPPNPVIALKLSSLRFLAARL